MPSINAVLFDLDDTLYDHSFACRNGLKALKDKYDCFKNCEIDELENEYLRILNEVHFSKILTGFSTKEEARIERYSKFFSIYGVKAEIELINEARALYSTAYELNQRAVTGAVELLQALKGKTKIGIVSNNLVVEQLDKINKIGIASLLDAVTISEEAGYIKPSPEIFHIALNRLHCNPENSIMIGDSWDTDIIGAKNAGINAIWFNRFSNEFPENENVKEINSLTPVKHILKLIF